MEDILVLLFHFEKVHKKTSYLKQAACLVYKNKVLLKIVHRFPSSYKAWLTLSLEDEQLQVCILGMLEDFLNVVLFNAG